MITGFSVLKRMAFRTSTQEFQNVYYYQHDAPLGSGDADTVLNSIVETEKKLHSSAVSFVYGRVWQAGGTPLTNIMVHQKPLTGTGSFATDAGFDRERAFLVRWPAGKDIRGKPVFLRKWYHSCGWPLGTTVTDGKKANTDALTDADRQAIADIANEGRVRNTVLQGFTLCAASGRINNGPAECHRFLEHHQLGDQWRG